MPHVFQLRVEVFSEALNSLLEFVSLHSRIVAFFQYLKISAQNFYQFYFPYLFIFVIILLRIMRILYIKYTYVLAVKSKEYFLVS